jgi:hypothetical protein
MLRTVRNVGGQAGRGTNVKVNKPYTVSRITLD